VPEINAALLGNETYRNIAKRFGASESAVFRHQREHLPAALVKANDAAEVVAADSLMGKITQLEQEARRLGKKAEDAGDYRGAMAAVRELVRIVELLAKLQGELKDPGGTTVNVVYVNAPDRFRKAVPPVKTIEHVQEQETHGENSSLDFQTSQT
jgi:vancomycin resistance protein YoaR